MGWEETKGDSIELVRSASPASLIHGLGGDKGDSIKLLRSTTPASMIHVLGGEKFDFIRSSTCSNPSGHVVPYYWILFDLFSYVIVNKHHKCHCVVVWSVVYGMIWCI